MAGATSFAEASLQNDLGAAELWLPNSDKSMIFAAPDLIIHYIETHRYCPPSLFREAVIQESGNLDWDAAAECERVLNSAYQNL